MNLMGKEPLALPFPAIEVGCVILEASEKAIGEGIYTLEAFGKNLTVLQRRLLKLCRSKLMLPTRSILARNTKVRFINLKKILKTRKLSPPFPHLLDFFFLVCHTFFLLLHLPSSLSLSPGLDGIDLYQVLAADWYQHWTRDERTRAYKRLADTSKKIGTAVVLFDHQSNLHAASSSRGDSTSGLRWLKDVVLSKRTDNVFRMTMVGDPKIKLQEIGIPFDISESLIVAEQVNSYNFEKLNMSCNLHLLRKEGLNTRSNRQLTSLHKTNQLQVGDVVYRPLENGDIILVNRPPSVHQHSLIALSVMILPIQSVISINPLCCAPLLGDFDGDCLHGYVPQSIGCRVELQELLSLDNQLFNAQDGRSLVSLTHDSLTAAYLLTANREFLNKVDMQQLAMLCPFPMLPPAVVKTSKFQIPLWTGEQLFSMLLPPTMDFGVNSRNMICKGEVMASLGGSFWLQNTTTGLFTTMFKHYGRKALDYLCCSQELLCEYLSLRGLSVSLGDVYLSSDSYSRRKMMDEIYFGLEEAEDACQVMQLMLEPEMENLLRNHNKDEDTLDCMSQYKIAQERTCVSQVSIAAFKNVYHDLLSQTYQFISKDNSMLEMIEAGSKGSLVKLIQQGACLGLQLFAHPLPFTVPSKLNCCMWNNLKALDGVISDAAKCLCGQNSYAVISASFLDGLNPLECFVHAICGRANLFTENAELPGTLTRKLMFYMRDLYLAYDGTVRSAYGQQIVEFSYSILEDSTEGGEACVSYDGKGAEYTGLGGEPVGSWAACSISEAAYGSLDCLFVCVVNEFVFLDTDGVGMFYGGHDVQGTNFSPWIMHFHVSKSLKSVTADIGRDIHKRHLFMAADCLSVTGEFHGLSTKGLRQQRNDMSISSPFAQACLSNPVNCFVNAAKQGSMDHLSGTLDAVAWGKEAPIGTGGPFEIVYSGKV
ncbi:DNA-directed RNA polymerase [Musa troglodytarum]|uniref:DNA-directed RNA polymerase n=1 Tax=Musa troglodytarum TaxID=320322 RepID=A0A9E7H1B9_9LILI|nr:DNA-directed RNA polymerase [Musa troglodytarum]